MSYPYDWEYEGTDLQEVMEQGATKTYATNSSSGSFVFIHSPIRDKSGDIIGIIEVGTDMNSLTEKSREIQGVSDHQPDRNYGSIFHAYL